MSVNTYQCPNCGAGLVYDSKTGRIVCEYCLTKFSEDVPLKSEEPIDNSEIQNTNKVYSTAMLYQCQDCGAEIITDDSTTEVYCYYCHRPLVFQGKVGEEALPDSIITFEYTREQAVEKFHQWVESKKFTKKRFYAQNQVEKMTGVYFPYWLYSCETDNHIVGNSQNVTTNRTGNVEYTETKVYLNRRSAKLRFHNVPRNALLNDQSDLLNGLFPFDFSLLKKFRIEFLKGFQAEKKDVEKDEIRNSIRENVKKHSKMRTKNTVSAKEKFSVSEQTCDIQKEQFQHVWLPVWVLVYRDLFGKKYYFAMNGQTGEMTGKLPVSRFKVNVVSVIVFFGLFFLMSALLGG